MSEVKFEPVRRTLELTPEQQRVILEVLRYNHAYYVRNHDMQPHCMWPGELLAEMINALAHASVEPTEAQRMSQ